MEHDRRIFFYLAKAKVVSATSTANVLSTYDLSIWPNRIGFPLFDFKFHDERTGTGTTGRFHLTPSAMAKEKKARANKQYRPIVLCFRLAKRRAWMSIEKLFILVVDFRGQAMVILWAGNDCSIHTKTWSLIWHCRSSSSNNRLPPFFLVCSSSLLLCNWLRSSPNASSVNSSGLFIMMLDMSFRAVDPTVNLPQIFVRDCFKVWLINQILDLEFPLGHLGADYCIFAGRCLNPVNYHDTHLLM